MNMDPILRESLDECFNYFETIRDELAKSHHGQHVIISGKKTVSFHPTFVDGVMEARKQFKPGYYIVAPCVYKHEEKVSHFRSRVGV